MMKNKIKLKKIDESIQKVFLLTKPLFFRCGNQLYDRYSLL